MLKPNIYWQGENADSREMVGFAVVSKTKKNLIPFCLSSFCCSEQTLTHSKPGLKMTFLLSYELIHLFGSIFNVHRNINTKRAADVLVACLITCWQIVHKVCLWPSSCILTHALMVPIYWYISVMCDLKLRFGNTG